MVLIKGGRNDNQVAKQPATDGRRHVNYRETLVHHRQAATAKDREGRGKREGEDYLSHIRRGLLLLKMLVLVAFSGVVGRQGSRLGEEHGMMAPRLSAFFL